MTLWDELGGRTWGLRAGLRAASPERSRRRRSQRRAAVRPRRQRTHQGGQHPRKG
jgi:hypothetical protein